MVCSQDPLVEKKRTDSEEGGKNWLMKTAYTKWNWSIYNFVSFMARPSCFQVIRSYIFPSWMLLVTGIWTPRRACAFKPHCFFFSQPSEYCITIQQEFSMELQWPCVLMMTCSRGHRLLITEMACHRFHFSLPYPTQPKLLTTSYKLHCRPAWFTALQCKDEKQKTTTSEKVNWDPSASWRQDKHSLQIDH